MRFKIPRACIIPIYKKVVCLHVAISALDDFLFDSTRTLDAIDVFHDGDV